MGLWWRCRLREVAYSYVRGGGGGGGYYGGGGGDEDGGGGGGGSSFIDTVSGAILKPGGESSGGNSGHGYVKIEMLKKISLALDIGSSSHSQLIMGDGGNVGIGTSKLNASLNVAGDISCNDIKTQKLIIGINNNADINGDYNNALIVNGDVSCNSSMFLSKNIIINKAANSLYNHTESIVDISGGVICNFIENTREQPNTNTISNSHYPFVPITFRGKYLINNPLLTNNTKNTHGNFGLTGHVTADTTVVINSELPPQDPFDLQLQHTITYPDQLYDWGGVGTKFTFTSGGKNVGHTGPTLSECRNSYGGSSSDWWNDTTNNYLNMDATNSPGIQEWTVPYTGDWKFKAFGADSDNTNEGGRGAIISANVSLNKGDVIYILCGQKGKNGGGAGGTFVVKKSGNTPNDCTESDIIVIAGGGGGFQGSTKMRFAFHSLSDNSYGDKFYNTQIDTSRDKMESSERATLTFNVRGGETFLIKTTNLINFNLMDKVLMPLVGLVKL